MKQRSNPLSWITVDDAELSVDEFPDGSFRFTVDYKGSDEIYVTLKSTLPEAIIAAYQVCGTLSNNYPEHVITLVVQTMPDQRADREEIPGMSNPASVSAFLIGQIPVDFLVVYDLHSNMSRDVLTYMCDNNDIELVVHEPLDCFINALSAPDLDPATSIDYVVAVDKGAIHRAETVAKYYGAEVIYCDKKRVDGKIIGHEIVAQPEGLMAGKNIWVVDDLCDGGATFISVAKLLREHYDFHDLNLYVTHGLFSKGKEELFKYYTTILALFDYSDAN